jgi:hypothetical protein
MSAEERVAAEHRDVLLFQAHPKPVDCPICFLALPINYDERAYKCCCGQSLCVACVEAMRDNPMTREKNGDICPFCKAVTTSSILLS